MLCVRAFRRSYAVRFSRVAAQIATPRSISPAASTRSSSVWPPVRGSEPVPAAAAATVVPVVATVVGVVVGSVTGPPSVVGDEVLSAETATKGFGLVVVQLNVAVMLAPKSESDAFTIV